MEVLTGVKIRRALGPMTLKITFGPSKLILGGPAGDSDTILSPMNEIRIYEPLKIVRALKDMTLRVQMTLGIFCLF